MNILEKFGYTSNRLMGTAIGNEWLKSEKLIASFNPNDGSKIAEVGTNNCRAIRKSCASCKCCFFKVS